MSLLRSILLLAGVVCSIASVYVVGHALSVGHGKPWALAAGLLAAGIILLTVYHRTGTREGAASAGH